MSTRSVEKNEREAHKHGVMEMRRHASRPLRTFKVAAYIYILLLARIMYVYVLYLSVGSDNVVFLSHIAILWTVLTSRLASHCITSAYLTCTHVCKLGILPLSTGRSVTIRHTASGLSRHEVAETINMNVRERTGDEENGSRSAPHPHRTASDRFLQVSREASFCFIYIYYHDIYMSDRRQNTTAR